MVRARDAVENVTNDITEAIRGTYINLFQNQI